MRGGIVVAADKFFHQDVPGDVLGKIVVKFSSE